MRTHQIAHALYHSEWLAFAKQVLPPWIDGHREEEQRIKALFDNAKEVIRQRDQLTELRPDKKEVYRLQCEEIVSNLAIKIKEHVSLDAL